MGGGHRPGEVYKVTCEARDGLNVLLVGSQVTANLVFTDPADANYYSVGKIYVLIAVPAGGDSMGQES